MSPDTLSLSDQRSKALATVKSNLGGRSASRESARRMAPVVADIDQLSEAISHATAPAFMLGAVAGFLSILIARLERIGDRRRALRHLER